MDIMDITDLTLEESGWGLPLPPIEKQQMMCVRCGADALYLNGNIYCDDLCTQSHTIRAKV